MCTNRFEPVAELENHSAEEAAVARRAIWLYENRESIDAYNRRIEEEGTFSRYLISF